MMRGISTILLLCLVCGISTAQNFTTSRYSPKETPSSTLEEKGSSAMMTNQDVNFGAISMEDFKNQSILKDQQDKGLQRVLQFDEKGYVAFYPNLVLETIITTRRGTKVLLSKQFIEACDPTRALELQMEEFLDADQIIKSDASTFSKGQLLRSAGMVRVSLRGTHFSSTDGQNLKIILPIEKIEGVQPFVSKDDVKVTDIDWNLLPQERMEYIDSIKGYAVEIMQVKDGMIAVNCDVAIAGEPFILKVKKNKADSPSPSIIFPDGTITNLLPLQSAKSNAKTQYFLFPRIFDKQLVVKDIHFDKNNKNKPFETKIKLDREKIKKSKLKKLSNTGYVILNDIIKYDGV